MDTSLATYQRKVEEMIEELKKFTGMLNHHVIMEPKFTIGNAVRNGLPEDIAMHYLHEYYSKNESDAQDIIRYINNDAIPYLDDVALYIESAIGRGNSLSTQNTSTRNSFNRQQQKENEAIEKNNREIEESLGIKKGVPMSIELADKQNANNHYTPEYIEDPLGEYARIHGKMRPLKWWKWILPPEKIDEIYPKYRKNPKYKHEYSINCATCAIAYVLRLRGFPITAKGNIKGTKNEDISKMGIRYFNLWKNADGSAVSPITTKSWAREKRVQKMTSDQYRSFFEETCKEKGVYILTLAWAAGGGHATILQRDDDGLHFIEPQVYQQEYTSDGRRSIDDLLSRKLHEDPLSYSAILRVDDKLFDEKYADLFELLTETNHENT